MEEQFLMTLLSNYGFPVVVALWFMFRTERVIKNNTEALIKFAEQSRLCRERNQKV